jgi:hypothetical protein
MNRFTGVRGVLITLLSATVVLPTTLGTAAVASKPQPVAATYAVQGVPGTGVDISVDGQQVESDVQPTDVVGPLDVGTGDHTIEFSSPDWRTSASFTVDRASQDLVLHWAADAADKPVVTVFRNDLSPVSDNEGRLTVAHTAVVPPADILASGKVLFSNIANGEFVTAEVPADTYSVSVVPTGGGDPLLGPLDLPVKAGALTRVFAIGTPRDSSMDAVVQVLPVEMRSTRAPTSMDTGAAGLSLDLSSLVVPGMRRHG